MGEKVTRISNYRPCGVCFGLGRTMTMMTPAQASALVAGATSGWSRAECRECDGTGKMLVDERVIRESWSLFRKKP